MTDTNNTQAYYSRKKSYETGPSLVYFGTIVSYSCTVVQLYSCTVVQLYSCTVVQLYSCKLNVALAKVFTYYPTLLFMLVK